jgi:hypothetical protein
MLDIPFCNCHAQHLQKHRKYKRKKALVLLMTNIFNIQTSFVVVFIFSFNQKKKKKKNEEKQTGCLRTFLFSSVRRRKTNWLTNQCGRAANKQHRIIQLRIYEINSYSIHFLCIESSND